MRWLLSLVALALASCGLEPSAGGGGFGGETTAGLVVDSAGVGMAGARLRLRASRSIEGTVLAEAVTDDSGRYRFEGLPSIPLRMEVSAEVGTDSVIALAGIDPGRSPGRVVVARPRDRRVRLLDSDGRPLAATIQAYGWGVVGSSDDSGVLRLSNWPVSDVWVRVSPRSGGTARDLLIPARTDGDLVVGAGWLLDDFEGDESRTRLGLLFGGGWWYATSRGEDSAALSGYATDIARTRDSSDAHDGRRALRVRFDFRDDPMRYGIVGCMLGPVADAVVDWSAVDSIEFRAKGSGAPVRLELVGRDGTGNHGFIHVFTPATSWQRVAIPVSTLSPLAAGETWSSFADKALLLQFYLFDDGEFRIDGIRIHGSRLP